MDLNNYLQEYNFNSYLEKYKENFKQSIHVKNFLENNSEEAFMRFSKEFWEKPNSSIELLKEKHNITKQISFADIIKSYPVDKYIKFLKLYYNNSTRDILRSEFGISYGNIEKIIVNIVINDLGSFCPECFIDSFMVERTSKGQFRLKCQNCRILLDTADLLTKEHAEQELEKLNIEKEKFEEKMSEYEEVLKNIKCPKCQEELCLSKCINKYKYEIKCTECNYFSDNFEETVNEFQAWKQRAAMIITIKSKEQELIEKALKGKKEKNTIFAKEDIITSKENDNTFYFFRDISSIDNIEVWRELYKRIRLCNRLEKKVLSEMIKLSKKYGEKRVIPLGGKELELYSYMPQEPIIYDLIDKTKIIVMRQVLRKLIKQNIIIASEELNYISIPKVVIDNLEAIEKLLSVKDINPSVRYLVFQRQDFTCMTCGETGRPLKIAYLSCDKNINNLDNLMALCDNCYEITTKNEILIDGTITFEIDYLDNTSLKSFEFLTYYYPELKGSESIRSTLEDWESNFNLSDIVKALAITIDKIKKNKIEGTMINLINYANGILKKSYEADTTVNIYESLKEQYDLKRWIGDI